MHDAPYDSQSRPGRRVRQQAALGRPGEPPWRFHNLHTTGRYAISLRAPRVLPLRKQIDWTIGERPGVARFLAVPHFSAFVVVRGDRVLY